MVGNRCNIGSCSIHRKADVMSCRTVSPLCTNFGSRGVAFSLSSFCLKTGGAAICCEGRCCMTPSHASKLGLCMKALAITAGQCLLEQRCPRQFTAGFERSKFLLYCTWCNQEEAADWAHLVWHCPGFQSTRPARLPRTPMACRMCWPPRSSALQNSEKLLHHMATVREQVMERLS